MANENNPPTPENPPVPAPTPEPAPQPAPPLKAATTVANGKTEAEIALENKLAAQDKDLREAQTKASLAEDELQRLKAATAPTPDPVKKKKGGIRWTLLHPDPDDEN